MNKELAAALAELRTISNIISEVANAPAEIANAKSAQLLQIASHWMGDYSGLMLEFCDEAIAQIKFQERSARLFLEKYGVNTDEYKVSPDLSEIGDTWKENSLQP